MYIFLGAGENVGISRVQNANDGAVEELAAGRPQGRVVSGVVMDLRLGQHGHVLDLALPQMRAIGRDEDHLGLALPQGLDGGLVAKDGLARLHDQLETTVHVVLRLFLFDESTMHKGESDSVRLTGVSTVSLVRKCSKVLGRRSLISKTLAGRG